MHSYVFVFLVAMGFCHVGQAGLELLASSNRPTSAYQSTGIIGVSTTPCLQLNFKLVEEKCYKEKYIYTVFYIYYAVLVLLISLCGFKLLSSVFSAQS